MKYSLLIIDDEESIRDSLSMALGRQYEVRTCATGKEALRIVPALAPDLALLDIGLPDIRRAGWACKHLHQPGGR